MIAERVDRIYTAVAQVLALCLLGWFGCAWWYQTGTFEKTKTTAIIAQAEAGCEHWRANKSATIAKLAIRGAISADAPIPSPSAIPQDRCPHMVAH